MSTPWMQAYFIFTHADDNISARFIWGRCARRLLASRIRAWHGICANELTTLLFTHFHRAICTAWIIIISTAIPAGLAHGVVNYPYNDRNYTACLFLVEQGYNIVAFQVSFCQLLYMVCMLELCRWRENVCIRGNATLELYPCHSVGIVMNSGAMHLDYS